MVGKIGYTEGSAFQVKSSFNYKTKRSSAARVVEALNWLFKHHNLCRVNFFVCADVFEAKKAEERKRKSF